MKQSMLGRLLLGVSLVAAAGRPAWAGERPNIVWIVSEDNSMHYLRHFFPGGAAMASMCGVAAPPGQ